MQRILICESAYNAIWILELQGKDRSPAEREGKAQWLFDQSVLDGAKIMRLWAKHNFATPADAEKATAAEDEVRKRRGMGPKDKLDHPNLYERAADGGDVMIEDYDLFYRAMCFDAHATIQGMMWAIEGQSDFDFERNLFMVGAVTLKLLNACFQLMGRTDFPAVQKEVEALLGVPLTAQPPGA